MKLYPGQHGIYNTTNTNPQEEIPLCYIEEEYIKQTASISISENFNTDMKKELLPYQQLDTNNVALYNKFNIPLEQKEQDEILKKENNSYIYTPKASIVYEPYIFNYKVIAKKSMKYISSRRYNINVGCSNEGLAKYMIQFFSDSYNRNLCPSNIRFNNGSKLVSSLINKKIKDNDFIFFDQDDINKTILNECIENQVVPIIICDKLYVNPEKVADGEGTELLETELIPETVYEKMFKKWNPSASLINNNNEDLTLTAAIDLNTETIVYSIMQEYNIENKSIINSNPINLQYCLLKLYESVGTKYHKLFVGETNKAPIVIKEITNKGFIIYCTADFINELSNIANIFYEIIAYVYFRAYISTDWISEWITDTMPNYITENGRLIQKNKFTSHIELYKLLKLKDGDVTPIEVKILSPDNYDYPIVYYSGMFSNYLIFKKINIPEFADPIKEENQISIYTSKNNIIYYDYFVYQIEENLTNKITYEATNDLLKIRIAPFLSSKLNIRSYSMPIEIEYSLGKEMNQILYLFWTNNTATISSNLNNEGYLLATINIKREKQQSKIYDMRVRGGGLPESFEDNYDCLDIGSLLGRPYRQGGALITTVNIPIKYKDKEAQIYNIIYDTIRKYMIAEDYLILNLEFK